MYDGEKMTTNEKASPKVKTRRTVRVAKDVKEEKEKKKDKI